MANFVTTLPKLIGPTDYSFWEICVKSTLAFTTYSGAVFTAKDILNALALPYTTNMNEITRRNFLAIFNSTLPDNLSVHDQPNAETFWAYLWTLTGTPNLMSVFSNY